METFDCSERVHKQGENIELAALERDHQLVGGEKLGNSTVQRHFGSLKRSDQNVRRDILVPRGVETDAVDGDALVQVE